MSKVFKSVDELIGHTPLLELTHFESENKLQCRLLVKLEGFNPGGSAKDRVAKKMLDDAESEKKINSNTVIIEPTSGNTGIGLAAVAAGRGYRLIIVMPDSMSKERILLMRAYGAEVVLTDGSLGMQGAIDKAKELSESISNSFIPGQFTNSSNPQAHYETTGPEIWDDTDGKVDIVVAGVGTGGTITGIGHYLKEKNPNIKIVAVEPATSAFLSTGTSGKHDLQGIGAGFIPEILDTHVYDEIMTVTDNDAYVTGRMMGNTEGILVGISAGAAIHAAIEIAQRVENKGKTIVVVATDTGDHYLSTNMFKDL